MENNIPYGSKRDIDSGVNIGEVYGGVFSNTKNIEEFLRLGIKDIESYLPNNLLYIDFGGGQGLLTKFVRDYLEKLGHSVKAFVLDANEEYLKNAREIGLETIESNLVSHVASDVNLITMRSVLHYNPLPDQIKILENVYKSLAPNGFFVNQFTSGTDLQCRLRSELVNHPLLGRAKFNGQYAWVTIDQYMELLERTGFSSNKLSGYAPSVHWGPLDQWNRYHLKELNEAKNRNDLERVKQLENNREEYLAEAKQIVGGYKKDSSSEELGIITDSNGNYVIESLYPVVVSQKI